MDAMHLAAWRGISVEAFLDNLGAIACQGDADRHETKIEQLPDSRILTTISADLVPNGGGEVLRGPYLCTLYDPERGKTHCFVTVGCGLDGIA